MRIKKTILILLILFPLFLVFSNVWAEYKLEVGIPGQIDKGEEVGLADYVRSIYLFALGAIGVVALGALVFGGLTYMLSDTLTNKEEAKKWIWGAIGGLILGFSSYLILNTINPDLVRINPPGLELEIPPAPGKFENWQGKCASYPFGEMICLGNDEAECKKDCATKCQEFVSLWWSITEPCVKK
ncbi:pilin [Patescibacteria group bacterium]|nr:pilin [Patescibacteria group bacterium]